MNDDGLEGGEQEEVERTGSWESLILLLFRHNVHVRITSQDQDIRVLIMFQDICPIMAMPNNITISLR